MADISHDVFSATRSFRALDASGGDINAGQDHPKLSKPACERTSAAAEVNAAHAGLGVHPLGQNAENPLIALLGKDVVFAVLAFEVVEETNLFFYVHNGIELEFDRLRRTVLGPSRRNVVPRA